MTMTAQILSIFIVIVLLQARLLQARSLRVAERPTVVSNLGDNN